ncbi:MAG: hypothetical protein KGV51_01650 [Moraxellaceae bacterium]|nr:hypothetical protein [Moraxellaceae bacterium]
MTLTQQLIHESTNLPVAMQQQVLQYINTLKKQQNQTIKKEKAITETAEGIENPFTYDLQRMEKALASGFVEIPQSAFESDETLIKWIESGA